MTLHLVIHRPDGSAGSPEEAAVRAALRETVWEVADSHWEASEEAMLVSTDLSPDYLLSHFRRGLARRGYQSAGVLLVVPVAPNSAWSGLPDDAAEWVKSLL